VIIQQIKVTDLFPHLNIILEVAYSLLLSIFIIWVAHYVLGETIYNAVQVISQEFRGMMHISQSGAINAIIIFVLGAIALEEASFGMVQHISEIMREKVTFPFEVALFTLFFGIIGLLSVKACR
jgi:hypothetical protein